MTIYFGDGSSQTAAGVTSGGKILQVKMGDKTGTSYYSSWTWQDISLSCSITPASSSNKILVMFSVGNSTGGTAHLRLLRGSTVIYKGTGGEPCFMGGYGGTGGGGKRYRADQSAGHYLDSPSTTSNTTYKVQTRGNGEYINYGSYEEGTWYNARTASSIILMEVD